MTRKTSTINTDLDSTALLTIFNDLSEHPVKKFADKKTALKRVEALLEKNGKRVDKDGDGWVIVGAKARQLKKKRSAHARRRVTEPKFILFIAAVGKNLRERATKASDETLGQVAEVFENFDMSEIFPE